MPNAIAQYDSGDIMIGFSATATEDWIGDPNVPNGTQSCLDISDYNIENLTILGVTITPEQLNLFPEELQAALLACAEDLEFTVEEPYDDRDYDDRNDA